MTNKLTNRLLKVLAKKEYEILIASAEVVSLNFGDVVYEPLTEITHVYFPDDALISLLSVTSSGAIIEVAMIGNEGILGGSALLGKESIPYRALVQGSGSALKIKLETIKQLVEDHPSIRRLILRYVHALLTQVTQSAVCNRFHSTEERLARWLLFSSERFHSKTLPYTQEFLAHMLGADRVSVTLAMGTLKRSSIIRNTRGQVTILDRDELKKVACECYYIVKGEFDDFLGE